MVDVLTTLEGIPVHEGDVLYGLDDTQPLIAKPNTSRHKEFALMLDVFSIDGRLRRQWITNTHYKGKQVLFWEPRTEAQIAEFHAWEEEVAEKARQAKHQEWLSNLTDPDAYMRG